MWVCGDLCVYMEGCLGFRVRDLSWATANPGRDRYNLTDIALLCQVKLRERTDLPKATKQSYMVELGLHPMLCS